MRDVLEYGRQAAEVPQGVVTAPDATPVASGQDADQLAAIRAKVERLIAPGRKAGYKYAADNLEHWYKGSGQTKDLPSAAFLKDGSLVSHLKSAHLPKFAAGAEKRVGRVSSRSV